MLESAWIFLGRAAMIITIATAVVAAMSTPRGDGDALTMVGGVTGFILWGMWAYGALNVEYVNNGSTFVFSNPELTVLGIALAMIPGYLALTGPIELVSRWRNADPDDL